MPDQNKIINIKGLYRKLPRWIPAFAIFTIILILAAGLQSTIDHRTRNSDLTDGMPSSSDTGTSSDPDMFTGTRSWKQRGAAWK